MHSKKITLAVVDDNENFLNAIVSFVESRGISVFGFLNPVDFMKAIDDISPTIVLTDYCMPDMNGLQLLSALADVRPDINCILMSGAVTDDLISNAKEVGCKTVIQKGFNPDSFIELLYEFSEIGVDL